MAGRSYDQYCPIAVALDVIGDRWTLLILRELTIDDRRFTDLRTALPGIAPNLLADRLRDLQADGLVDQQELPPPAARVVYRITSDGREVIPVLRSLARFGAGRLGSPNEESTVRPSMAVYAMVAPYHRPEPPGERFHARLHVDGSTFDLCAEGDHLSLRSRLEESPDLELDLDGRELVAARQGRPLRLPRTAAAKRFRRLFQL